MRLARDTFSAATLPTAQKRRPPFGSASAPEHEQAPLRRASFRYAGGANANTASLPSRAFLRPVMPHTRTKSAAG